MNRRNVHRRPNHGKRWKDETPLKKQNPKPRQRKGMSIHCHYKTCINKTCPLRARGRHCWKQTTLTEESATKAHIAEEYAIERLVTG